MYVFMRLDGATHTNRLDGGFARVYGCPVGVADQVHFCGYLYDLVDFSICEFKLFLLLTPPAPGGWVPSKCTWSAVVHPLVRAHCRQGTGLRPH